MTKQTIYSKVLPAAGIIYVAAMYISGWNPAVTFLGALAIGLVAVLLPKTAAKDADTSAVEPAPPVQPDALPPTATGQPGAHPLPPASTAPPQDAPQDR